MSNRTKKARADALKKAAGANSYTNTKTGQHITKISAKPGNRSDEPKSVSETPTPQPHTSAAASPTPAPKANPTKTKSKTKKSKGEQPEKPLKEVFILARPFVALGRYLRDSWREIRQVRWPNRKNTWKMTLAVLAYCAVFIVFIMLLDTFFTFLFKTIVK